MDSRPVAVDGVMLSRRRKCHSCGETFTTHEVLAANGHPTPDAVMIEKAIRKVVIDVLDQVAQSLREATQ